MRSRAALLTLLVVCALLAPVAGGATAPATAQQATQPPDTGTSMQVHLLPGGSAEWNVTMRFEVTDNGTAFSDVATAFENGEADVGPSPETFTALAGRGSDVTGREMSIADVDRRGWRPTNDTGALTLTFTWNGFAAAGPDRVNVSGAFGPSWNLEANQRLVVYPPDGYLPSDFQPSTDNGIRNGVLRWEGSRTFVNGQPRIAYSTTSGQTTTSTNSTTTPAGPGNDGLGPVGLVAGALMVVLLALGGYILSTREGAQPDSTSDPETESELEPEPSPTESTEEDTGDTDSTDPDAEVDETLLSDEERVERLLKQNGGRMKQANIVDETGWSNAKVSQLLSTMTDEGQVEKLRIGRENLISLPDESEDET